MSAPTESLTVTKSPSSSGAPRGSKKSPASSSESAPRRPVAVARVDPDGVRDGLQKLIAGGHVHDLKNVLPQMLQTAIEHEVWKLLSHAGGTPFTSLGDFLLTGYPFGLGCEQYPNALTYGQLMEVCDRFPTVVDALAKNAPKGKRGGNGSNQHTKKE